MPFLPISTISQLSQLGAAVEVAGSAVSANLADFLQALTERLSSASSSQGDAGKETAGAPLQAARPSGGDLAVIRRQIQGLVAEFQAQMQQVLAAGGLSSSSPFAVTLDESGVLHASQGHPDAQQIDNLIAENSTLTDLFRAIQSRFRLVGDSTGGNSGQPLALTVGP